MHDCHIGRKCKRSGCRRTRRGAALDAVAKGSHCNTIAARWAVATETEIELAPALVLAGELRPARITIDIDNTTSSSTNAIYENLLI